MTGRYERVALAHPSYRPMLTSGVQVSASDRLNPRHDMDDMPSSPSVLLATPSISSRPPSFSSLDPLDERNEPFDLAAAFDPDDEDDDDDETFHDTVNEHTRLHRPASRTSLASTSSSSHSPLSNRPPLAVPSPFSDPTSHSTSANYVPRSGTDGVFANLSAKPDPDSPDEKYDEPLPSYEVAAADAAPPYWETTIITPGRDSDEVYVDGFPVGTFFAFIWNAMISMSFQFVGFLLTYLLASSHAARNGSRAGLGVILIQYGFYLRDTPTVGAGPDGTVLPDPNDTDDSQGGPPMPDDNMDNGMGGAHFPRAEWMSYLLMVIGWFILIRSVGEYYRVKQLEKAVRATPTAFGAAAAVVAEGEGEAAV
jgi:Protein of unknown function (DUF2370)